MLNEDETARSLARNPISHLLPMIEDMLAEATEGARYFAALSDADGVLLWAGGPARALEIAEAPAFLPGHLASEDAVGTNAIGTALVLDHPVQIFSAEHFSRLLHGWTCSAAPIHDPETHETLGVLDISGEFRSGHPHSLALVGAVARVAEGQLAQEQARRDERLREVYLERIGAESHQRSALVSRSGRVLAATPRGWLGRMIDTPEETEGTALVKGTELRSEPLGRNGARIVYPATGKVGRRRRPRVRVQALGHRRARITVDGEVTTLSPRHSQIAVLLALQPAGLSVDELGRRLYGPGCNPVTVRAEVSRLRRRLGPVLASDPYRFDADLDADWQSLRDSLGNGGRARVAHDDATPLQPPS
jgi:hypothetical protein